MRSQRRVHWPELAGAAPSIGGEEARRLIQVLRLAAGDRLELFDGAGGCRAARILERSEDRVQLAWDGPLTRAVADRAIWAGVAVPKGKRADVMVEKLTELGVAHLAPLLTERGVARPEAEGSKARRWESIAEEAARQCRRNDALRVDPPQRLEVWLASLPEDAGRYFAHLTPEAVPARAMGKAEPGRPVVFAVGPEGGWVPAEVESLTKGGFHPVSLGPLVLRVETAAIALAAVLALGAGE